MKLLKQTACLCLTLALCAGLLSGLQIGASAATLSERQQAIVDVALAYWEKGMSIQYDGSTMVKDIDRSNGGKTRSTNQVPPEYATPNETMFTVCSDFAHQVYYEAYRYQLTGSAGRCWTGTILDIGSEKDPIANNPVQIYRYEKEKSPDADPEKEIANVLALAQPGDLITVKRANGHGHTMIFVGNILGDGSNYLIHSGGGHLNADKRTDRREKFKDSNGGGSIRMTIAENMLRSYLKETITVMNLLRPLVSMSESDYPILPTTAYRMAHPRLAIERTLNKTRFNSTFIGDTVTMTLKLTNGSPSAYTVAVTEKTPAGAKLKTPFAGAAAADDTQKWDVELKAGESKTFTAEYEITAPRGEKVVFEGGSVGDIPSNVIPVTVGGKKLTAAENAKLAEVAEGKYNQLLKDEKASNDTLGDVVYQKILGLGVQLPDFKTVATKFIKAVKTPTDKATNVFLEKNEVSAADLSDYQMLVPTCRGGGEIWYPWGIDRCSDPRDMHVEPGDVIVRSDNLASPGKNKSEQLVYLGDGKYLSREGSGFAVVKEVEFFRCILNKVFYVLRPTLAFDDIHTLAGAPAAGGFKFTDVKESDWFYTYVKDLVADGAVNGMTETTFAPNGTLTYGQALKLIALAVGEKEPAKSGSHWASGYASLAKSKGWLAEDVNLDGTITRLALCKIAAKAKNLTAQPDSNPFKDTADKDVLALNKAGVINGMTATEFKPEGLLTRAQISKIIWTLRKA